MQPELGGEFGSIERTEPCEPGLVGLRRERYLGARVWRQPATMR